MLKSLNRFIKNNDYTINIWENNIDIINFSEILILEENKVVLLINNKRITIIGENLTINKLLDNEILLKGKLKSFEIGE
ncbi:MAG: hypothetical protein IJ568_03920 [Bacilli bacterium]|nr:hypothetical protein [Bacilli bacterium]